MAGAKHRSWMGPVAWWAVTLLLIVISQLDLRQLLVAQEDLGWAAYPAPSVLARTPDTYVETKHRWAVPALHSRHQLVYALGHKARATLEERQLTTARDLRYIRTNHPCARQIWSCVYEDLDRQSAASLQPLHQRLASGIDPTQWNQKQTASWLLAFVQHIPYKIPVGSPFQVAPPSVVASQYWGDCDSKSLLLLSLLDHVGIRAEMLVSTAHKHAMVGIAVPIEPSKAFSHAGTHYAWAEVTAKGAPLGYINPRLKTPNDWKLVPIARSTRQGMGKVLRN